VVVMVALAERHQRHPPAISAGIGLAVWLATPEMADRIDAKCRIEYGKCAADAGKQEAAQAADPAIMEKPHHERQRQT